MESFEMSLKSAPIYVGGTTDKADRVEVKLENGRTSMQFRNNNYYNNGNVNQLFVMFLHGYAAGKCEERLS
jgi:hypothetical protein